MSDKKGTPVPEYADLMTVDKFVDCVECGLFIDYDGHGFYVKDGLEYEVVHPSDLDDAPPKEGYTHVAWYNK